MLNLQYEDDAKSLLASGMSAVSTTATVVDGSVFPAAAGDDDYFFVTIRRLSDGAKETVRCTGTSGNVITISDRAQGTGEVALVFVANDTVTLRVGRNLFDAMRYEETYHKALSVSDVEGYEGIAGQAIYLSHYTTSDDGAHGWFDWNASDLSTEVAADTRQGIYIAPTSDATGASGAWVRRRDPEHVHVPWFGVSGGVAAIEAAVAMLTASADNSAPIGHRLTFGAHTYTIASTCDLDVPQNTFIDATGATFHCTANSVAFDLNPTVTALSLPAAIANYAKRRITWSGGQFYNDNVTKTASAAIQAYAMRRFTIEKSYFTGFYQGIKYSGLDTYTFRDCFFFNCEVATDLVNGVTTTAADVTLSTTIKDCHVSCAGMTAGHRVQDRFADYFVRGGSVNGATSSAQIHIEPTGAFAEIADNYNVEINDVHFEQQETVQMIYIAPNTTAARYIETVAIDNCHLITSAATVTGMEFDYIRSLVIGQSNRFRCGVAASAQTGINIGANCTRVHLNLETYFTNFSTELTYSCARSSIRCTPEYVRHAVDAIYSDAAIVAAVGQTIDVSAEWAYWASKIIKPIAIDASLAMQDSASAAAAANATYASVKPTSGSNDQEGLRADVSGLANSTVQHQSGSIALHTDDTVYITVAQSGTATCAVRVNAAYY